MEEQKMQIVPVKCGNPECGKVFKCQLPKEMGKTYQLKCPHCGHMNKVQFKAADIKMDVPQPVVIECPYGCGQKFNYTPAEDGTHIVFCPDKKCRGIISISTEGGKVTDVRQKTVITMGRNGDQPFPIVQEGVSARHASLTIRPDGTWVLEDLGSTNGTYVRNKDFVFERIGRKVINKDDVIRLGCDDTIRSIQFQAVRLVKAPDDFSFEFAQLKKKWKALQEERSRLETQTSRMSYLPVAVSVAMLCATITVNDIHIIRGVMVVPTLLSPIVSRWGKKKLAKMNEGVKHTFVCPNPKCGLLLTETEIKRGQCLKCKAHI